VNSIIGGDSASFDLRPCQLPADASGYRVAGDAARAWSSTRTTSPGSITVGMPRLKSSVSIHRVLARSAALLSTVLEDSRALPARRRLPWRFQKADQLSHRVVAVPRMPQRHVLVNLIQVASPIPRSRVPGPCQIAGIFEVIDDLRGRALGNADVSRDVSQTDSWVGRNCLEHVGVVGHEPPRMMIRSRGLPCRHVLRRETTGRALRRGPRAVG
jgi:hypothetical protein